MTSGIRTSLLLAAVQLLFAATAMAQGATEDDSTCWKPAYGRAISVPNRCPFGKVEQAGLCYDPVPERFVCSGLGCWARCPSNAWGDNGAGCGKPGTVYTELFDWFRGASSAMQACEAKYGRGNCEDTGWTTFNKCPAGFKRLGMSLSACVASCPLARDYGGREWIDHGLSCQKPTITRAVHGAPQNCPPGMRNEDGLCYSACKEGYAGIGAVCWAQSCPRQIHTHDCGAMCGKNPGACAQSILNQIYSIAQLALQVTGISAGLRGADAIGRAASIASIATGGLQLTTGSAIDGAYGSHNPGSTDALRASIGSGMQSAASMAVTARTMPMNLSVRGGLAVGAATNLANLAVNSAITGKFDPKQLLGLDPVGFGAVALAFWLPTCSVANTDPPMLQMEVSTDAYTAPTIEYITWDGSVYQSRVVDWETEARLSSGSGSYLSRKEFNEYFASLSDSAKGEMKSKGVYHAPVWEHTLLRAAPGKGDGVGTKHHSAFLAVKSSGWMNRRYSITPVGRNFYDFTDTVQCCSPIYYVKPDGVLWRADVELPPDKVAWVAAPRLRHERINLVHTPDALSAGEQVEIVSNSFNFVDGDGALWSGRRSGSRFDLKNVVSQGVGSAARTTVTQKTADSMTYLGWDYNKVTATWNGDKFVHRWMESGSPGSAESTILNTWDWGGNKITVHWNSAIRKFAILNAGFPGAAYANALNRIQSTPPSASGLPPIPRQFVPLAPGEFFADYLEYVGWDKAQVVARRSDNRWSHTLKGSEQTNQSDIINYLDWTYKPMTSRWSNWEFSHTPGPGNTASTTQPKYLQFTDWAGRRWKVSYDPLVSAFRVQPSDQGMMILGVLRKDLAGKVVKSPDAPAVFFVTASGEKWEIVSPAVFTGCGFNWNEIQSVTTVDLDFIRAGGRLESAEICTSFRNIRTQPRPQLAGTVIKAADSRLIYFIDAQGRKLPIASGAVFEECGLDWKKVDEYLPAAVNAITFGGTLTTAGDCRTVKSATPAPQRVATSPAATTSAVPITALAGKLISVTDLKANSRDVYLVNAKGLKQRISSPAIFQGCGFDSSSQMESISAGTAQDPAKGADFSNAADCLAAKQAAQQAVQQAMASATAARIKALAGKVIKAPDSPNVYLVNTQGQKQRIADAEVFSRCGFGWGEVLTSPAAEVNAVPTGPELSTAATCLAAKSGAPAATPILENAGTLVKAGNDPTIYLVNADGHKQAIASAEVFVGCRLDWNSVRTVSSEYLSRTPTGRPLSDAKACRQAWAPAVGITLRNECPAAVSVAAKNDANGQYQHLAVGGVTDLRLEPGQSEVIFLPLGDGTPMWVHVSKLVHMGVKGTFPGTYVMRPGNLGCQPLAFNPR